MENTLMKTLGVIVFLAVTIFVLNSSLNKENYQMLVDGKNVYLLETKTGKFFILNDGLIEKYELKEGVVQFIEETEIAVKH